MQNHLTMDRDGAGAQGRDIISLDPIKRHLAEILNANEVAKSMLREEPTQEQLVLLYAEQQDQETFLLTVTQLMEELIQELQLLTDEMHMFYD